MDKLFRAGLDVCLGAGCGRPRQDTYQCNGGQMSFVGALAEHVGADCAFQVGWDRWIPLGARPRPQVRRLVSIPGIDTSLSSVSAVRCVCLSICLYI